MNTYAYVNGNPVNAVDPLGLEADSYGGQSQPSFPGPTDILFPGTPTNNAWVQGVSQALDAVMNAMNNDNSAADKKKGVEEWNKNPPNKPGLYTCRYVMYFPEDQCKEGKCPQYVTGRGYDVTLAGAMSQARTEAQDKIPAGCGHQHHGQMWCSYAGNKPFMP